MSDKLWFLAVNDDVIGVFDDYEIACEEKDFLKDENHKDDVVLKKRDLKKLDKYSDEYYLAKERGYFMN